MYPNTKIPSSKNWNRPYDVDFWRKRINANYSGVPNLGILLGSIVDVEADSEDTNQFLIDIIGDYPHPCFKSSRSIHHLFISPDKNLTHAKFNGIEFRGKSVCSVVPPSLHADGTEYKFLKESKFPIPSMPSSLLSFYWDNKKKKIGRVKKNGVFIKKNHKQMVCQDCRSLNFIHYKRLKLEIEAFRSIKSGWECRKCRKINVSGMCRKIRRDS